MAGWIHGNTAFDDYVYHESVDWDGLRAIKVDVYIPRNVSGDLSQSSEVQIARLIAWLDHIAPEGIISPPPKAEDA